MGGDASTEQERRAATVGMEHVPVEGLAGAAEAGAGSVEQEIVADAFVAQGGLQVLLSGYGEYLDDAQAFGFQFPALFGRFLAVQLDVVQAECLGLLQDTVCAFVDKDTDSAAVFRQVVRGVET